MISLYSKRMLYPYIGIVQIAEAGRARAMSPDGMRWAIQYAVTEDAPRHKREGVLDQNRHFAIVATVEDGQLNRRGLRPYLDTAEVRAAIDLLYETVTTASLPFPAADRFEYWLLDHSDQSPLALLHSCVRREEMVSVPRASWVAMPAAQLEVHDPDADPNTYVPPVNYRLQQMIEERAGPKPRAVWFDRTASDDARFPPCLIREDWEREQQQKLCNRYIDRLAPRLLMIHGLPRAVRSRLEHAAREHALEVEQFFLLYPEVVDETVMNAARVEAKLRRAGDS